MKKAHNTEKNEPTAGIPQPKKIWLIQSCSGGIPEEPIIETSESEARKTVENYYDAGYCYETIDDSEKVPRAEVLDYLYLAKSHEEEVRIWEVELK